MSAGRLAGPLALFDQPRAWRARRIARSPQTICDAPLHPIPCRKTNTKNKEGNRVITESELQWEMLFPLAIRRFLGYDQSWHRSRIPTFNSEMTMQITKQLAIFLD